MAYACNLLGIRSASYRKELFIGIVSFFAAVDLNEVIPLLILPFPYFGSDNQGIII